MPKEYDAVPLTALETLPLALQNFIAHCGPDGILGKIDIQGLTDFLVPLIANIGATPFIENTGSPLPNPVDKDSGITIVGAGTFAQTTGSDIVTTEALNVLFWDGTSWSVGVEVPISIVGYLKEEDVFNGDVPTYLDLDIQPGAYRTSAEATNYEIGSPVSTITSHTYHYPAVNGNVFAFEGLSATLVASNMGALFDADGDYIASIAPGSLVAITGGYKYTVPATAGIANIGFNIRNADIPNIKIQRGATIVTGKIKTEILSIDEIRMSQLNNDNETLTAVTGVEKETLFDGTPADYLESLSFASGFYANSGTGFPVTASTTTYHSVLQYAVIEGDVFAIEGLDDTLSASNVGKLFNASGVPIGTAAVSDLVVIDGGHKYTVPVLAGVAFIGFNVRLVDVPNIKIQKGGVIQTGTIKEGLLPVIPPVLPYLNTERFIGKDGLIIADSIGTDDRGYATKPFPYWLKQWLQLDTMFDNAESGTGLVRPFSGTPGVVNRLDTLPADVDYWWLWIGMNDFTASFTNSVGNVFPNGLPIGEFSQSDESFKELTFYGALHFTIKSLIEKYPLKSGMVIICTPRGTENLVQNILPSRPNNYGLGWFQNAIVAIKEVCNDNSIPYLDLYNNSGLAPWITANNDYFFDESDMIHPNDIGHLEKIAPKVFEFSVGNL